MNIRPKLLIFKKCRRKIFVFEFIVSVMVTVVAVVVVIAVVFIVISAINRFISSNE